MKPVQLRDQASQLRASGEHLAAIRIYSALIKRTPLDYRTRVHLAEGLALSGAPQAAARVYRAVAELCTLTGRPLVALVACREIEVHGEQADQEIDRLARLYGAGSPSLAEAGVRAPGSAKEDFEVDEDELREELPPDAVLQAAADVGADLDGLPELPCKYRPIPLLSELGSERMAAVIRTATVHRLPAGHVVFRQGAMGKSCFLIASGAVSVVSRRPGEEEQTQLATLSDGAIFGEMSLITNSPRSATAETTEETDLLELGPEALAAIGDALPRVAAALDRLAQRRWMSNLMAQSPFFKAFDDAERGELLQHFAANEVPQGTVLLPQGELPGGVYLLVRGEVGLVRRTKGKPKTVVSRLGPGSTLGLEEILADSPVQASATAMTPATVLFLSEDRVRRLIEAVPELATAIRNSAPLL